MRESQVHLPVHIKKYLASSFAEFAALFNRLTASACAPCRAGHALDKIIMNFAVPDVLAKSPDVTETVSDSDSQFRSCNLKLSLFDSVIVTNIPECVRIRIVTGNQLVCRS